MQKYNNLCVFFCSSLKVNFFLWVVIAFSLGEANFPWREKFQIYYWLGISWLPAQIVILFHLVSYFFPI